MRAWHICRLRFEHYETMQNGIHTLRVAHAFIDVEDQIDGRRVGGNGTFVRVQVDLCCKDVLAIFLAMYVPNYSPLPDNSKVILLCTKISDTVQGNSAPDIGVNKDSDCSDCLPRLSYSCSIGRGPHEAVCL